MAMLPVQREGLLSDNEALRRYTRRPQTIVDALYLSQKDFIMGFMGALAGACLRSSHTLFSCSNVGRACSLGLLAYPCLGSPAWTVLQHPHT